MDLFSSILPNKQEISKDAYLLKGFALAYERALLADLAVILKQAPLRHMMTKMGFSLSASMTNCGALGWVSDRSGYRYDVLDSLTNQPWPTMPLSFQQLAESAAIVAGFKNFQPDVCLINQYKVGAGMGLHQDKNELDFDQPIVSVSLGMPAVFQFGGLQRNDKIMKLQLYHGDVVVWGGESRLKFHGIMPLKAPVILKTAHPALAAVRINLTFRKAG